VVIHVRAKPLQGRAVRWDGANAADLASLAGDLFEGTYASSALIRGRDGELIHVRPGWVVSRWDGVDGLTVSSAGAWEAHAEEVPS
jgi:hypothetical protein